MRVEGPAGPFCYRVVLNHRNELPVACVVLPVVCESETAAVGGPCCLRRSVLASLLRARSGAWPGAAASFSAGVTSTGATATTGVTFSAGATAIGVTFSAGAIFADGSC